MSHAKPINITREFYDLLSKFTYNGEGEVAWHEYLHDFLAFLEDVDEFDEVEVSKLLSHTLRKSPQQWCRNLPHDYMHSLKQLCDLIESTFHHFDPKPLDKKLIKQWKDLHKSPMDFWQRFRVLRFEASKNQMKFQYLWDRFEYYLHKSLYPKINLKFKPHSAYFGDGVAQSQANIVVVTGDCLPSPHQTSPPPHSDVGEHAHTSFQMSYPPSITSLNFHADLVANPMGYHMHLLPQHPSSLS